MTVDQIVDAVCLSPGFRRSERAKKILRFLAANSQEGAEAKATRKEGLAKLNGHEEATLPTLVSRLQERLERFFASADGARLSAAIEIVRGSSDNRRPPDLYALRLKRNLRAGTFTHAFWQSYFDPAVPTWIVYGEPLFMKEKKKKKRESEAFIRNVQVNRREEVPKHCEAVYPFLRLGEVRCMLEITRYFAEHKVPLRPLSCRRGDGLDHLAKGAGPGKSHLIVLGNTFSNGVLVAYQNHRSFPFFMEGATILKRRGRGSFGNDEEPEFADCVTTHALVSRRKGFDPATCVTTIASDNGRAIYRIGQVLCDEAELDSLSRVAPLQKFYRNGLPREFQLIFKVWVHEHDTPIRYEVVDWWPRDAPHSTAIGAEGAHA